MLSLCLCYSSEDGPPPYTLSSASFPVVSPTSTTLVLSPTIISTAEIDMYRDLPKYNETEGNRQPPQYKITNET